MPTFRIKHGLTLQSAAAKLLSPKTMYSTDDEAQLTELRGAFTLDGAVEELVPQKPEAPSTPEATVDPSDDITLAKGVGAGLSKKLAEKGISTLSGLKAAITDQAREEEMKELLGSAYPKVLANFVEEPSTPEE